MGHQRPVSQEESNGYPATVYPVLLLGQIAARQNCRLDGIGQVLAFVLSRRKLVHALEEGQQPSVF